MSHLTSFFVFYTTKPCFSLLIFDKCTQSVAENTTDTSGRAGTTKNTMDTGHGWVSRDNRVEREMASGMETITRVLWTPLTIVNVLMFSGYYRREFSQVFTQ